MIKNSLYTYDYFQPEEYKFSLDSVFLAQKTAKYLENETNLSSWSVLDLCAGCGIIGLELSLHAKDLRNFDFLEIQETYKSYFEKNVSMIYPQNSTHHFRFLNQNYQTLLDENFENHYDLIVSNPPYFFKNEGLLSPSDFKNRCRFFLDSDFETLIRVIIKSLKPSSSAYILVRSGVHHGRSPLQEIRFIMEEKGHATIVDNIRGTDIIQITKARL